MDRAVGISTCLSVGPSVNQSVCLCITITKKNNPWFQVGMGVCNRRNWGEEREVHILTFRHKEEINLSVAEST